MEGCLSQPVEADYKNQTIISKPNLELNCKHTLCRHQNGCLSSALHQSVNNAAIGLAVTCTLKIIQRLVLRQRKNLKIFSMLRLPCFLGFYQLVSRLVHCALRRVRNRDDFFNCFTSGFFGALSMMFISKKQRNLWVDLILMRLFDAIYRSSVNRGIVKHRQLFFSWVYSLTSMLIAYSYFSEPMIARHDVLKVYRFFDNLTNGERTWQYCHQLDMEQRRIRSWKNCFDYNLFWNTPVSDALDPTVPPVSSAQ